MKLKHRVPTLAGLLSLILPGLGQIYDGRLMRGIFLLLGYGGLLVLARLGHWPHTFRGLVIILGLISFYVLFVCVDAVIIAIKTKSIELKIYNRWYIYSAIYVMACVFSWTTPSFMSNMKAYSFPSGSMLPTLQRGDKVMVDLGAYSHQAPHRGDLIVFAYPPDPARDFLKRLVAFGGEEVLVKNNTLFIDGKQIYEPYLQKNSDITSDGDFGPETVPQGTVFVLGDNRANSADSRQWGEIDIKSIRGKALYIYYSKDYSRIGLPLKEKGTHDFLRSERN